MDNVSHRTFITDQTDIEFLKEITSGKLAGISLANVDILLGSDYFWRIVDGGRIVLPSGLLLISSKLGYVHTYGEISLLN